MRQIKTQIIFIWLLNSFLYINLQNSNYAYKFGGDIWFLESTEEENNIKKIIFIYLVLLLKMLKKSNIIKISRYIFKLFNLYTKKVK